MPRITTTTNVYMNKERKYRMLVDMRKAIELIPCEKGEFLMADFQDESFILFGENPAEPCVSIELNILDKVFNMTDKETLEAVLAELTNIASEYCCVPKDRIFAFYRNASMWAAGGINIDGNLLKI